MQKTKKEILFSLYRSYLCLNGHEIKWEGSKYVFGQSSCEKCKKKNNSDSSVIRWSCPICNHHYCSQCFLFFASDYCPLKEHKLQYITDVNGRFSTYYCDICYVTYKVAAGMWYDNICNITFCNQCKTDGGDIPEDIEE